MTREGSTHFSSKWPGGKYFRLGHTTRVAITQFCGDSTNAAIDNPSMNVQSVFQLNFIYKDKQLSGFANSWIRQNLKR